MDKKRQQVISFLKIKHKAMRRRARGVATRSPHIFLGLSVCPLKEFLDWAIDNGVFLKLYDAWILADKDIKLTPVAHRVLSSQGYEVWNMLWMTNTDSAIANNMRRRI